MNTGCPPTRPRAPIAMVSFWLWPPHPSLGTQSGENSQGIKFGVISKKEIKREVSVDLSLRSFARATKEP